MSQQDEPRSGMVDADQFLRLREALRTAFRRIEEADLSEGQRRRWHRRLIGITNTAKQDLDRAEQEYASFEADFTRLVGTET